MTSVVTLTPAGRGAYDPRLIAATRGVIAIPGPVQKDTSNPVLRPDSDRAWESMRVDAALSAMRLDDRLRLYYAAIGVADAAGKPASVRLAYTESNDSGRTWRRPDVGDGTNVVLAPASQHMVAAVIHDALDDEGRRFKLLAYEWFDDVAFDASADDDFWVPRPLPIGSSFAQTGLHVAFSPDGRTWSRRGSQPVLPLIADSAPAIVRDPVSGRYLAFIRGRRRGLRSIGLMESTDFVQWSAPRLILVGTPRRELYALGVTIVGDLFIGTCWIYDAGAEPSEPVIWPELMVSLDGRDWTAPTPGRSMIPLGPRGSDDSRQIRIASSLVADDDELLAFYGQNGDPHVPQMRTSVGVARMSARRLVGLESSPDVGHLTTHPLLVVGSRLELDLETRSGGFARVLVRLPDSAAPAGWRDADGTRIRGNGRTQVAVSDEHRSAVAGAPVVVEVELHDAALFGIRAR